MYNKERMDVECEMYVTKRNGKTEVVSFDKILQRIKKVGMEVNLKINYTSLVMKVIDQLYDKISTRKIDELTAEQCASMSSTHPDYNTLAGRITVSNHHKNTDASFTKVMNKLYNFKNKDGKPSPLISKETHQAIHELDSKRLNNLCDYSRDYLIDYFGFKTLERSYLMRVDKQIVERPQHMWLRVSIGIHGNNWAKVEETYRFMSQKYFTHATPTLFNAGTPHPQLSSCFLMAMEEDSIDGIFQTLKECALISKWAGGIGLHIHNIRAAGSHIHGTNGSSNGIVPMLRVFNNTAKYVDQCVTPDTFIYTTKGPKRMEHLIGNETFVINATGAHEVVENVLEHSYDGPMIYLKNAHSSAELKITPEHPLLILEGNATTSFEQMKNGVVHGQLKPSFIEAKNVTTHDYMVYKIPHYESTANPHISNLDCYVYGILLLRGDFLNSFESVRVYFTEKETSMKETFHHYLNNRKVKFVTDEMEPGWDIISWKKSDAIHLPFRKCDFYNEANEQCIAHKWLTLPLKKVEEIARGLLHCIELDLDNPFFDLPLTHRVYLIESIKYLFLRMGVLVKYVLTGKVIRIAKTEKLCQLTNHVFDSSKMNLVDYFVHDKFIFSPIVNISHSHEYKGTLYDLQMKYVHNYMISDGIIHNGGGKRNGSFAIYLEPWHADIEMFLQMRKNHGDEELKARDLFYALWTPDLFMKRVKTNGVWTLMCPMECPGLSDVYGPEFEELYTKYEKEGKGRKTIQARDLWLKILDAQMETGTPYLLFKDAANQKSNQKNVGTIKSSNLCVTPETMVLTREGQFPIYCLWSGNYPDHVQEEKTHNFVDIWNGEEYSTVEVVKTGENQTEFLEVETSDGAFLTCTPYHKFYVYDTVRIDDDDDDDDVIEVEAQDLTEGMRLQFSEFPIIRDGAHFQDGTKEAHIEGCKSGMQNITLTHETSRYENLNVPINHCLDDKLAWFSGFIEPYLSDLNTEIYDIVHAPSRSYTFLQDIKYMLQTCGVNVVIRSIRNQKNEKTLYELIIHVCQIKQLMRHNLQFSKEYWEVTTMSRAELAYTPEVRIKSVSRVQRTDDTYCFTEPKKHAGIFNGIRTGQCTEIIEYSDKDETAVCNLASIGLPTFVSDLGVFDYELLHEVTKVVTGNLNRIIDINYYPTEKTRRSNMRHRPIGIGIQGLADVFLQMGWAFACPEARQLNRHVFETIYHASLEKSCELAEAEGAYETFAGSPASKGILQFDLWNVTPDSGRYDWDALKQRIMVHGLRNSLLVAPMPTASTSQILGFNECMEPITSNIYSRRTLAGEFILVNKYLMQDLLEKNMWNEALKNHMVANNGSIQSIDIIPKEIKDKYKTVWEMPMRDLIDMAADRGAYICQSQSLNLWLEDPNYGTMTSMHFYSWSKGLKTGIYYLRRRPRHHAQQFTIEPENKSASEEVCEMCSA